MKQNDLATTSVAESYLSLLSSRGIDYLFANGGTDFAPLAEALAKMQAAGAKFPQPMIVPHENVAVAMAHGYFMCTGRVQAVMVHVSLGTANAINGIYNASRQNVPILFTAGRTPLTESGLPGSRNNYIHWAQEMFDQGGMVRELVKWDYELRHAAQLETVVDRALALATSEPQGPVYLTLPREVLAAPSEEQGTSAQPTMRAATRPRADPQALAQLAQWLRAARAPLIITSDAGREAAAMHALDALAARFAIPVVQYRPRYLCLPSAHEMHCGFDPAQLIGAADLVLVLDCDVPWIPDQAAPAASCKVVHLGVDPLFSRYPLRGFRSDLAITGDTASALINLGAAIGAADAELDARIVTRRKSVAAFRSARGFGAPRMTQAPAAMSAKWFSRCIDAICDAGTVVVNEYPLMMEELSLTEPGSYFANSPAGGLGWGLGAALGIKLARPQSTVIAAVGDGAYMFGNPTPAHFVSRANDLPVLFVIFNNRRWAAVHRSTLAMYPNGSAATSADPPFASLEPSPEYEKIVAASGGYGECVGDPAEFPAALQRALHAVKVEKRQAVLNVLTEVSYVKSCWNRVACAMRAYDGMSCAWRTLLAEFREIRLALFEESTERFLGLRRAEQFSEIAAFGFHLLLHHRHLSLLHQLLGQAQRGGRLFREFPRLRVSRRQQLFFGHDRGHQADFPGFFGRERLPEQKQLGCAHVAGERGQQQARRRFRHQSKVDERHLQARVRRRVHQVAMQQHGGADAHRRARHRGDERLLQVADGLEELEHRPVFLARRIAEEVLQVVAAGKQV